ncbi:type II toxin-antitoxin system RatA family toxin [Oleispirillum naphthae]|uniref:type II toxin-antitoxin system RatA family toxin n=1 Tax=Oleispirillum naphthae TaxID=2838853 RepID=UPI003082625D
MRTYAEQRWLKQTPEQLYALVADIGRYPEFLPWCLSTRILSRESGTELRAEMEIGFKMVRERYVSRVTLTPHSAIDVESLDGLFRELHTHWQFDAAPQGGTLVGFEIRFAFRSRLFQTMIGAVFNEAARLMVRSFEKRATALYG